MKLLRQACLATLLLLGALISSPAWADQVAPSARVTSAVMVREGPSTQTAIRGRLRPGESAQVVGEVSGWYEVELADGTRGFVSKSWTVLTEDNQGPALTGSGRYKVHVIDVGTGLAVFVEGEDFALLYDAGSQDDLHEGAE